MAPPPDSAPPGARWLVQLLDDRLDLVRDHWVAAQLEGEGGLGSSGSRDVVTEQSQSLLMALREGVEGSGRVDDISGPAFRTLRRILADISLRGVRAGSTPSETAQGVLALREALFSALQADGPSSSVDLGEASAVTGRLVDTLALLSFEEFVRGREEIIRRQSAQLHELSTPVVQLWDGIIAVPLVGTLDSSRAQVVMESLLQAIVDERALVAILDITGVPTVDTLVAQHLLKTVTATRLMGADCIISGIRPQTAQTIVQLGIDLADITTRATLADALATAITRVSALRADVEG